MGLTLEQATKLAQIIWRRAPSLPTRSARAGALQRAANLVALARGRERLSAKAKSIAGGGK
jgi:hypothetical protein